MSAEAPAPPVSDGQPLRVLLLEDSPLDAELVQARLEDEGIEARVRRVETREGFLSALADARFDVILCDYNVPGFDGSTALSVARAASPDTPFLFVSGALGEDKAIELLKRGATDYVLKDRLERLVPCIRRALREAQGDAVRRRAEERLRQSEERYRLAILATSDAIWDWDLSTQRVHWNEALTHLFGYGPEEVLQDAAWRYQAIHPEDRERVVQGLQAAIDSGERRWQDQYRFRHKDGSYTAVVDRGHVDHDATGRPMRMVGAMQDVSAQKEAEAVRLRQARASQLMATVGLALTRASTLRDMLQRCAEALVQHLDAAFARVWLLEDKGDTLVLEASAGLYTQLEGTYSRLSLGEYIVGRIAQAREPHLTHDVASEPLLGEPDRAREDGMVAFAGYPLLVADKLVGVVALFSRHALPQGILDTLQHAADSIALGVERLRAQEETARLFEREKSARATAEEANRLKDEFLATVSHELRTPLTAMLGWVQMLKSGSLPAEKHARALETVERNARSQAQLVEDLLDVSRIMAGKLKLEVEPLDVAPVVEQALETVRPAAEARGIRLQAALDSAVMVMGDAHRLQQVVWNLLSNAVKFTPKGGRVQVLVERRESSVEITVVDTGEGIAPDFLPHVFERFRQADGGSTRRHGGLGLGLSIVRHLVELHGGTVSVASEGVGQGATFTVRLPLAVVRRKEPLPLEPVPPEATAASTCPPELDGLHVLVVDDEADTREFLRHLLEGCKARVSVASSAARGPGGARPPGPGRAPLRHRHARRGRLHAHPRRARAAPGQGGPHPGGGPHRVRPGGGPHARAHGGLQQPRAQARRAARALRRRGLARRPRGEHPGTMNPSAAILLVEDDAASRAALLKALEPLGQRLVVVETGEAALEATAREDFAVILLDIRLPGTDGLTVAAHLKRQERNRDTPLLFITGLDPTGPLEMGAYATGAVDLLFKPLNPEVLRTKVRVFLGLSLQHQQHSALENEERHRLALQAAGEIVWDWNLLTHEVHWNDALQSVLGHDTPRAGDGTRLTDAQWWLERIHPEDRERVEADIHAVIQGRGSVWESVYRFQRGDGAWLDLHDRGFVVRDAQGQPVRMVGAMLDVTRQRRTEVERERLDAIFMQAPVAIVIFRGPRHVIELANPSMCRIWGRRLEDMLGKPHLEALPEMVQQGYHTLLDQVFTTGVPYVGQEQGALLTRGGDGVLEERYFNFVYEPMRDRQGHVDGIIAVASEVTEQVRARQRIERIQAELEATIESIPDAAYVGDLTGIKRANQMALKMLGYQRLEEVNIPFDELTARIRLRRAHTGEPVPPEEAGFARALSGQSEVREYLVFNTSTGRDVRVRSASSPVWLDGKVIAAVVVNTDITEQHAAEDALRRSEEEFRTLTESLPQGIWTALPDGTITYVNGVMARYSGEPLERLVGQSTLQLIHPDDVPACLERWTRALETREPYEIEARWRRHDGAWRWHLVRAVPLKDASGAVLRWLGSGTDVQELRQFQTEMERRMDFEKQLIGIVSHDLRNPLSAILLGATSLSRRQELDVRSLQAVVRIQSSAERATRMIRDLLDFTQARLGGGIRIQRGPMDLHRVMQGVLEEIEAIHPEREVRMRCIGDGRGDWDSDRLAQVVQNLVTNALKYSPPDTPVRVETRGEDGHMVLTVHNGGPAIPPERREHLFEPLRRATIRGRQRRPQRGPGPLHRVADRPRPRGRGDHALERAARAPPSPCGCPAGPADSGRRRPRGGEGLGHRPGHVAHVLEREVLVQHQAHRHAGHARAQLRTGEGAHEDDGRLGVHPAPAREQLQPRLPQHPRIADDQVRRPRPRPEPRVQHPERAARRLDALHVEALLEQHVAQRMAAILEILQHRHLRAGRPLSTRLDVHRRCRHHLEMLPKQ